MVWAEAVRGAAWKRWPPLGRQVREAGIYQEGLLGAGVICTKVRGGGNGSVRGAVSSEGLGVQEGWWQGLEAQGEGRPGPREQCE